MAESVNPVEIRPVMRRGCGYPKPGAVYLESQGEAGGTLPIIVVIDPPIPHSHFHRGWIYIDLDAALASQEVKYVGSSVASAEEWHLRQKYQGIARDVFGDGVRIKSGQIIRFRDTAARILIEAGWKPGGLASAMQAARILREHAEQLAALVEITKGKLDTKSGE
jgi:hypothetical protein